MALLLYRVKLVYFQPAYQAGAQFLFNIWHQVDGRFLTFPEYCNVYGQNISFLQYYSLVQAIPRQWVQQLKDMQYVLEDYIYSFESFSGKVSGKVYDRLTFKQNQLDTLLNKWETKLNVNIFRQEFLQNFQNLYKLVSDVKLRNFQFRYLHRIIFCARTLYKWKIVDSASCAFCHSQEETLEHLFYSCEITNRFWVMLIAWYEALTDLEITISLEEVSFCNHPIDSVNLLILIAKQHIFVRKIKERTPNVYILKDRVYEIAKIERFQALKERKFKKFIRKWKWLFPCADF